MEGTQPHRPPALPQVDLPLADLDAVVFDMDGVITDTAHLHADAWRQTFDELLERCRPGPGIDRRPFDESDYLATVDGKPRTDGVESFLASRGLALPPGSPDDPPGDGSVHALAKRKDQRFMEAVHAQGVKAFPSTVALIRALLERGVHVAVVSSSRHVGDVLAAAGVHDLFEVTVDGNDAERQHLPGKPDPAVFVTAADQMGVLPARAAVVEDAVAGVEAGRRGGFRVVIGVDRDDHTGDLVRAGADLVVGDLAQVELRGAPGSGPGGSSAPTPGGGG